MLGELFVIAYFWVKVVIFDFLGNGRKDVMVYIFETLELLVEYVEMN
jgi:hypothetical protein